MPAPLLHIALALIALEGPLSFADKKEVILGTNFPDIRYLNVIDREKTHAKNVSWKQIKQEKNHFKIGYLFHSFVDKMFDDFMQKNNGYEKLPKSRFTSQCFKIFSDKVLDEKIKLSVSEIATYFDTISPEELNFGVKKEDIARWHDFLKKYCLLGPKNNVNLLEKLELLSEKLTSPIKDLVTQASNSIKELNAQMEKPNSPARILAENFLKTAGEQIKNFK